MSRKCTLRLALITFLLGSAGCQAQVNPIVTETFAPVEIPTYTRQNTSTAAESPQSNIIVHAPTRTAGEHPASDSSLKFSQHGVTVTLTRLDVSSTETSLDFVVELDPVWGFTFGKFDNPPQDVFPRDPPTIVDETGRNYQIRSFHGAETAEKFVDSQDGTAHTVGHFIFEPLTGSRLDIAIPLMLFTVRVARPIRFTVINPDRAQSLAIDRTLAFGELQTQVKSAEWKSEGGFELTIDGSVQGDDLRPVCLYLYQDPLFPPPGYKGCFIDENQNANPSDMLNISPVLKSSQPAEVGVAAAVIFLKPFTFTWIRDK